MAYLLPRLGCIQMRPGSAFLKDLNQDASLLERLNFTSIWTPWDFIIVPARSSQMPIGQEVKLSVLAHALMVRDIRCWQAIAAVLSEPVKDDRLSSNVSPSVSEANSSLTLTNEKL
jgi:triacylglycerol lipase